MSSKPENPTGMAGDVSQNEVSANAAGLPEMREMARRIFLGALEQTSVQADFRRHVRYESGVLRICKDLYPVADFERISVIAFGKAAHTMAEALSAELGGRAGGIIVAPEDPASYLPGFRYFRGGHPVPDAGSIQAARAMLALSRQQNERSLLIYLISGGGSAVAELPLFPEIDLEGLQQIYRVLVECGAPIAEINAVRKHLSAIKGGRLAQAAPRTRQVSIMISDVPDDHLDALASGPTMPDSTTAEQCYEIAGRYGLAARFPEAVRQVFDQRSLEETPKVDEPVFANARWWPVLSSNALSESATAIAQTYPCKVVVDSSCDDQDYAVAADYLLNRLRDLREQGRPVCLLSFGEVTVNVSPGGGRGGRNQQFALYCATKIAGLKCVVLSAGSDGVDGNSPAAGAIVDGGTVARARALGLEVEKSLAAFDSHTLLDKLGDTVVTGPTGNNLRDLRVLIAF
ncbi:MAG TPA: DUF4147 domain-containing protein [Terriglobales bacterium]|nr:DUF4147 domain-containing protein [Terriglobales bacterium]